MATAAEIARIAALTEQLTPLASRRRGELIEADHWNTVVGALVEIARAVIAEGEQEVPPHDHPDQVKAGWLDPALRARLEKGPLADPASVARVAKLERGLDGLRLSLDGVRTDLTQVRSLTTKVETNDLDRKASLTRIARKMDGLGDARDDVSDVRSTLEVLRSDLDRVSTFARDLDIGGETISVASLVERIDGLEGLRSRLTGPNGEELNATSFEVRLAELAETLVTESELDQALEDRPAAGLSDDLRAQLLEASRVAAREQVDSSTADLEGRLTGQINTRFVDVEAKATSAAVARAEEVTASVRDDLRDELGGEIAAGDDAVRGTIDGALADVSGGLRDEIDERIGAVTADFGRVVDERLGATLPDVTAGLVASIAALGAQVAPLDERVATLQKAVSDVSGEAAALRRDLDTRTADLADTLRRDFDAALAKAVSTAQSSDAALANALRAEFAAERLRIDGAIDKLRTQLPGLVEAGVSVAKEDILATMRTEVGKLGAELDARVDRQVEVRLTGELERRNLDIRGGVVVPPINRPG
jgi:hypothetical protein